jgi:DNA-binding XRE family transcriptional regulator
MTTTEEKPLAFGRIDALRRHMLLTKTQMARLLGVSRVTYHAWEKAGGPSRRSIMYARAVLKELLRVMVEHEWPTPTVVAMDQEDRLIELQKLIRVV